MSLLGADLIPLDTQVTFTAEPQILASPTSTSHSSSTHSPITESTDTHSVHSKDEETVTATPSAWGRRTRKTSLPRSAPESRRRNSAHSSVSSWLSRVGPHGRQRWSWSQNHPDKKAQATSVSSRDVHDEASHVDGGNVGIIVAVPGSDATLTDGASSATPTAATQPAPLATRRSPWTHLHTFLSTARSNNNHPPISQTTSHTSVTATQHASSAAHSPESSSAPLPHDNMPAPGVGQDMPGAGSSPGPRAARLPSGAPHVVFAAAEGKEPAVPESPAPPSAHDAVVTGLVTRPSPGSRTVSSPGRSPQAPELYRSISTDSTPKQAADLAHRAKESERRDTESDERQVSAMMDGPLDPGGGRVTRALAAQIDSVLAAQEKIGQAHLALERIGADSTMRSASPDLPTAPPRRLPPRNTDADAVGTAQKDENEGSEKKNGDAADEDKESAEKTSASAEPSANDEIRRRAQGIEDIMAKLSELATSLKSYHAIGTPALVFPPSTKPHPISGLSKPPLTARSRQPLVTIATPAVARNVSPPEAAGTLPHLKTHGDSTRLSGDSEGTSAKRGPRPTFLKRPSDAMVASPAEISSPAEIGVEHKRPW